MNQRITRSCCRLLGCGLLGYCLLGCCLLGLVCWFGISPVAAGEPADVGGAAAAITLPRHTLIYGGDLFCARRLNFALLSQTDDQRKRVLGEIAPLLQEADLAMINLEGMVTTGGYYNRLRQCTYMYRAAPGIVDVLKDAGVDLVTIGNNHNGDYGPEAQVETCDHLAAGGIGYIGAGVDLEDAARPVYRQVGDVVVAIVGMEIADAEPYAAEADRPGVFFMSRALQNPEKDQQMVDRLAQIVREARRHAHVVLFSPHGGNRGIDDYVTPVMRVWGEKLIREAGFDAVLAHGAHHAEGVEIFDGKPVIYDAGNLVLDFDAAAKPHLDSQTNGMLWNVEFSKAGIHRLEGTPLHLPFLETQLATGAKRDKVLAHVAKFSREFGTPLRIENGRIVIEVDPGEVIEPTEEPKAIERPRRDGIRRAPTDVLHERLPEGATPVDVRWANGIRLVGYELLSPVLVHGKSISQVVVLYWKTDRPIESNYVVHLDARPIVDGRLRENVVIREEPHLPGDWLLPTYLWPVGKIIQDKQNLRMVFGDTPALDGIAFFAGLREFNGIREGAYLEPVHAKGIELLKGKLVSLGSRPLAKNATPPREIYQKWRENRKIELSREQPFGAPPLDWPPTYGGN